MLQPKNWSIEWGGRTLSVEVGKYALQADGACTVRYGDTVIMATAVMSGNVRSGIDYFPLMVDFEEKLYAGGKIKGSRFIKREGRPTDNAILSGRMIDRAIRPLFDARLRNDVQVVLTTLAYDTENDSAISALVAASIALSISSIPWNGPIAAARIGRINGSNILNATAKEVVEGDLDLVVAGTPEKLIMVEAGASELGAQDAYEAMKWGCEQMAPVIELIKKIQKEVGKEKIDVDSILEVETIEDQVKKAVRDFVFAQADSVIFDTKKVSRKERYGMIDTLKEEAEKMLAEKGFEEDVWGAGLKNMKEYVSEVITKQILDKKQRLDGRDITQVRELISEIDLLPRVHGSAMFMRGDTQVLSVVTLGSPGDVQTLDTLELEGTKRYMHHYNDAPFTYGDTRPMRGPSRRAIGHGALAERALEPVLPSEDDFPYAIRVVSEVLGANGSSSMASTCGSSLSLMAAGVPIAKPVAGIAMGLAQDNAGNWVVLTDLQDVEDGPGAMDFKIAGTRDGITAMQMDTKSDGITWDIVEQTVKQSHEARLHILDTMQTAIDAPRVQLSKFAPRIETIQIDPEKIGDVIGPGGKIIRGIIEETGVSIDIEDDGRVLITSVDGDAMAKAKGIIKELTREVMAGEEYDGKVVRIEDFGAFVNLLPGKDGLVHVSEIAWEHIKNPRDVMKLGDTVKVKVKEIDNMGRVNLSMKALIPRPEGMSDRPPRDNRPRGGSGGDKKPGGVKRFGGLRDDRRS